MLLQLSRKSQPSTIWDLLLWHIGFLQHWHLHSKTVRSILGHRLTFLASQPVPCDRWIFWISKQHAWDFQFVHSIQSTSTLLLPPFPIRMDNINVPDWGGCNVFVGCRTLVLHPSICPSCKQGQLLLAAEYLKIWRGRLDIIRLRYVSFSTAVGARVIWMTMIIAFENLPSHVLIANTRHTLKQCLNRQ